MKYIPLVTIILNGIEMKVVTMKTALHEELVTQVPVAQGRKVWKQNQRLDGLYAWNLEIKRKRIIGSLG